MNTIPTTFNPLLSSYTVVGGVGKSKKRERGVSLILLYRGGVVDRVSLLETFHGMDVGEILSIEPSRESYQLESLVGQFPKVRFVLLHEPVNVGQQINIGIHEASFSLCIILWADYQIDPHAFQAGIESVEKGSIQLCVTPWIFTSRHSPLPVLHIPAFHKARLKVLSVVPQKEEALDLFPFDYCGIYHKETFIRMGGYDYNLTNPYWQKLDFGFRSFLWGERIVCRKHVQGIHFDGNPMEDTTPDDSYRLFFLKNLSIVYTGDRGELPFRKFLPFYFRSKGGVFVSMKEFNAVRKWVKVNAYRFKMDSRTITELWEDPEE
ncbi:MAG: hypothetical protein N2442_05475 [Spirochaetes bacterium]|nr:hypothetical protein [Spirochaetota bacterium]